MAQRAARHAALADPARLAVVDELAVSDRSPSELQARLGLASNLLAHHVRVLEDVGIVGRRRSEGDRRRTYLTLADPTAAETAPAPLDADRVLFVCSANSARSQLAAALWTELSDVPVASAGTRPADEVAPGARSVADRRGLALLDGGPRALADVSPAPTDLVVAVCDHAYEELGDVVAVHWSVPDPVRVGDATAFDAAYIDIRRRVEDLAPRLIAS